MLYLTVWRLIRARRVWQHSAEADVIPVIRRDPRDIGTVVAAVDGAAVVTLEVLRGRVLRSAAPFVRDVIGEHLVGVEAAQVHAVCDFTPCSAQNAEIAP